MALNGNFTRVTLGVDDETGGTALFVEGRSEPPDDVRDIHVALPHGGTLLSAPVREARATDWQAKFPEGPSPFEPGQEVFVVGVAMREPPRDPFVWEASFTIESR